jgi:hypothetical protein
MAADDTSPKPTETVGESPPPEPIEAVGGNLPPRLIEALESLGDAPHGQLMEVMAIFDQTIDEVIPAKAQTANELEHCGRSRTIYMWALQRSGRRISGSDPKVICSSAEYDHNPTSSINRWRMK